MTTSTTLGGRLARGLRMRLGLAVRVYDAPVGPRPVVRDLGHPARPRGWVHVADVETIRDREGRTLPQVPRRFEGIAPSAIMGRSLDAEGREIPDERIVLHTDCGCGPARRTMQPLLIERAALEAAGFDVAPAA